MSSDEETPHPSARRSGRETKKIERLSDAATLKGKSRASPSSDDEEVSNHSASEGEDSDQLEDSDHEGDSDAPKTKAKAPRKTAAKAKGRASGAGPGRPKVGAKKATVNAKKSLKKAEKARDQDGEDGEAGGKEVEIEEDNEIFNAVSNPNSSLQSVVDDWIQSYQSDAGPALAELINFVLRTCGCNASIDEHQALDEDGVVESLDTIQEEFKDATLLHYPLVSKSKAFKKFRPSLLSFLSRLILSSATSEILYDPVFTSTLVAWLTSLSSSKIRSFRHSSTVISLALVSALAEVGVKINLEFGSASRAKEAEEKKAKSRIDKSRLKDLEKIVLEVHERKEKCEEFAGEWFDSVFVHRYRDSEPLIRAECVKSLGSWMKVYPDHYLDGNFLRYIGWVLSDGHKDVRIEAIKALRGLYTNKDHIGSMQHFTERFKAQIGKMATQEVDLSVRITSIQVLRLIDQHGFLDNEDGQRDALAKLIFAEEKRVRSAVGEFFGDLLDEEVDQMGVAIRAAGGNGKKGKEADLLNEQLNIKCLAGLFVRYGHALDGEHNDEEDEDVDGTFDTQDLPVQKSNPGRIARVVDALWECENIDTLRDWGAILSFLLLDHSGEEAATLRPKGKGRKAAIELEGVEEAVKLTEEEESILIEILVASLAKITTSTAVSKKDQDKHDDVVSNVSRVLMEALPRLFAKNQTVPSRLVDILSIPRLLSLELYLDMRMITAYEALWDDVMKQFTKHANAEVMDQAVQTIQFFLSFPTLGNTNTAKLSELQDQLIDSLREILEDKDIESVAFEDDEILILECAVARLHKLMIGIDMTDEVEESDGGKITTPRELLSALAERGMLGYKEEAVMIEHALGALSAHLTWRLLRLHASKGTADAETVTSVFGFRTALLEKCEEYAVGVNSNAAEGVKRHCLISLVEIHTLSAAMTDSRSDPDGRLADLKLECGEELQARCAGFVEAQIERYADILQAEREDEGESEEGESDEGEEATPKQRKGKGKQVKKVVKKKVKRSISSKVTEAMDLAKLLASQQFATLVGCFVRAIHAGVFELRHASIIFTHFGRFDSTFDQFAKILIEDLTDEGVFGDQGAATSHIIAESYTAACQLFIDSSTESTEDRVVALSRGLVNATAVRGKQLSLIKRMASQDHIRIHSEVSEYLLSKIAIYDDAGRDDEKRKAILCFKGLTQLVFGMDARSALKAKTNFDALVETKSVQVRSTSKTWEPLRSYEKRLTTAISKDAAIKVPVKKPTRAAEAAADPAGPPDQAEAGADSPAPVRKRPKARRVGQGKAAAGSDAGIDDDVEALPPRGNSTRKAKRSNVDTESKSSKKRKVQEQEEEEQDELEQEDGADEQEEDEEEEEVENLLVPSSQVPQSASQARKRAAPVVENEEEEEEEGDYGGRSPSPAASIVSLSDIKRMKKKARR